MFRDDRQRARACRALLVLVRLEDLFTVDGPTPRAVELFQAKGAKLSTGEAIMFEMAFGIWNGRSTDAGVVLGDLLRLDSVNLQAVGELLAAAAGGAEDLDAWLEDWAPTKSES